MTWEKVAGIHPFVPVHQAKGYQELFAQLERWLAEITGFAAVSLQPNAGSQGEYAGLLAIRKYHLSRGQAGRDVCLIPPQRMAPILRALRWRECKSCRLRAIPRETSIVLDLDRKIDAHRDVLAALMITYPSTHGVFEESIEEICAKVHAAGGMVYMDGANMNAQVGLCRPAADRRGCLPSQSAQDLLHSARRWGSRCWPDLCRSNLFRRSCRVIRSSRLAVRNPSERYPRRHGEARAFS